MATVLVMYSREFEPNGLAWRVETNDRIFYVKHVDINVPSTTLYRKNATPAYVLRCEGLVEYLPEKQTVKINPTR